MQRSDKKILNAEQAATLDLLRIGTVLFAFLAVTAFSSGCVLAVAGVRIIADGGPASSMVRGIIILGIGTFVGFRTSGPARESVESVYAMCRRRD